ncbi:MAG: MFS transporter, partial [Acidobacteriaceae bacterium]
YMVVMVFAVFFIMSFVTNILGPIVPDIISSFDLSLTAAAFLPFSFFIAYGVLSIPAGFLVELWGEKKVVVISFAISFVGSLIFALMPVYEVAIGSLFLIGGSMAALQVALNPLLRTAGGEENFAFYSAFAQLVFGSASFVSPQIYTYIIRNIGTPDGNKNLIIDALDRVVPAKLPWISMYWIFTALLFVMILFLGATRFPKVIRAREEEAGTVGMYRQLLRNPAVILFFISVFFYVGSEQGTANWISEFLHKYYGYDPHTTGAMVVAYFWGLFTVGCFVGMLLLKFFDSRIVLRAFAALALVSLTASLFGPGPVAKIAFPCIGLFASVMWPIIISLALNSVLEYHGPLAGILCSGIMGGAVLPLVIGRIGDISSLRVGMCILYLSFGWVLCVSFWAKPLVVNKTIFTGQTAQ